MGDFLEERRKEKRRSEDKEKDPKKKTNPRGCRQKY